jgi:uridine kinase
VILVEGIMTFVPITWLAVMALTILVTINGVATGCKLIADSKGKK